MIHGDDKGLVLPPKIAQYQVVLIPVFFKGSDDKAMVQKIEEISWQLKQLGVRTHIDDRDNVTSGFKYNHWEVKGVPIRIELGPKDYLNKQVRVVKRNDGKKIDISWEAIATEIPHILDQIQLEMYVKAIKQTEKCRGVATNWKEFLTLLNQGKVVDAMW